jgi:hypothetical protein
MFNSRMPTSRSTATSARLCCSIAESKWLKGRLMRSTHVVFACLVVTSGLTIAAAARAETITYQADLAGSQENPTNDGGAKGHAVVKLDTETKSLSWTVEYSGLSGIAMGAHIHGPAAAGTNAGILIPFQNPDKSPITGSAPIDDQGIQYLKDGRLYVNIHTMMHPGGEIRGQLLKAD